MGIRLTTRRNAPPSSSFFSLTECIGIGGNNRASSRGAATTWQMMLIFGLCIGIFYWAAFNLENPFPSAPHKDTRVGTHASKKLSAFSSDPSSPSYPRSRRAPHSNQRVDTSDSRNGTNSKKYSRLSKTKKPLQPEKWVDSPENDGTDEGAMLAALIRLRRVRDKERNITTDPFEVPEATTVAQICERVYQPRCAAQATGSQGFAIPPMRTLDRLAQTASGAGKSFPEFLKKALPNDINNPSPYEWGIRSNISWAVLDWPAFSWPSPQDSLFVFDQDPRSLDLTYVAVRDHTWYIYGVSEQQRKELHLPDRWPRYRSRGRECGGIDHVVFEEGPLPVSSCDEWVEESTFFLGAIMGYNMYHLHNDNVMPMFSHLRSLNLLGKDKKKRLYIFPEPNVPEPAIAAYNLLKELFDMNTFEGQTLHNPPSKTTCFKHARWGRHNKPGLVTELVVDSRQCTDLVPSLPVLKLDAIPSPNDKLTAPLLTRQIPITAGDSIAWQHWVMCRKDSEKDFIRVRPNRLSSGDSRFKTGSLTRPVKLAQDKLQQCKDYKKDPQVMYFDRDGHRSISNSKRLVAKMAERGLKVNVCCDFKSPEFSLDQVFRQLQKSDIMWSIHGAAMGHSAYLPPGGVVVEMQPQTYNWLPYMNLYSRGFDHTVVELDARAGGDNGPYILPEQLMDDMITEVLRHWNMSQPCTQQEFEDKNRYYNKSRPYTERFPMSDLKGNRHQHIEKAVASF